MSCFPRIKSLIVTLACITLLIACVPSGYKNAQPQDYRVTKDYPRVTKDANILLHLISNIQRTTFNIDGEKIGVAKRMKVFINNNSHTVQACPDGYICKEEFIQPPYYSSSPLRFTFLLSDRKDRNRNTIRFPTDKEIQGLVKVCSAGYSERVHRSLETALDVWKQKSKAKEEVNISELGGIIKELTSDELKAKVYKIYIDCIRNFPS